MNFFEHQDQARKQSRWLILVFIVAVLAIVVAIDLIVLLALGVSPSPDEQWQPFAPLSVEQNMPLLIWGGIATVLVIALASLFKTVKLAAGGGQVARELGATLVGSNPGDPLRRRLRNVVEEIALASGVPVPEIYVMEHEGGINAFAAGYSPADAAVTVTRGALESLNRDELQGVVAHEFSHILNGDMRINIRLMGVLFGILLLSLIGRRVLVHTRHVGGSRNKGAAAVLLIAFGLMVVGYIGQFFGRWIKAAISRQREYLADASAVQFTRDPNGIGGALKKIAVLSNGSHLQADTEEISHMLFGDGRKYRLFSTHPPLSDRIRRIDPGFRAEDLDRLRARMVHETVMREKTRETVSLNEDRNQDREILDAGKLIDQIGQPQFERMLMAAALTASIPGHVRQSAQSPEWAPEVLFYSLLDQDRDIREQQLLLIAGRMGQVSEEQVRALMQNSQAPSANHRLPLLELAFPALKRRPPEYIRRVLSTVQELVEFDGRTDVFEYLLARLITQYLWESQNPQRVRSSGKLLIGSCLAETSRVLAILANHGNAENRQLARAAYAAGMASLETPGDSELNGISDWVATLDTDLPRLDQLRAGEKQRLVNALVATVSYDNEVKPVELELLRAICGMVHVPLPMLAGSQGRRE